MNRDEANKKAKSIQFETEILTYLKRIETDAVIGGFETWYNTSNPNTDALNELIKNYGYRVFIRKGMDCNGYPLWCIYWGDEENPIPNFNISDDDKNKTYELNP